MTDRQKLPLSQNNYDNTEVYENAFFNKTLIISIKFWKTFKDMDIYDVYKV